MDEPDQSFENLAPRKKALRVLEGGTAGGRELPHSCEAEEHLLSSCLLDGATVMARCQHARITPAAFYDRRRSLVFEVCSDLWKKNLPVEVAVVAEELKARRTLDEAGGVAYLAEVSARVPTTAQAGYFIEKVRELAVLRAAIRDYTRAVEECHASTGELAELLGKHALKAQRLADFALRGKRESLRDRLAKRLVQTLEAAAGRVDRSRWLTTGLPWLDACILPFDVRQEDWMVIIAGPPSGGKSSVMRQIAVHLCDEGKRGAVFLLETGLRWIDAAAASRSRVNLREMDRALKSSLTAYRERYEQLMGYAEDRLWVFEDLHYIEDIERQVREINRTLLEKDLAAGVPPDQARGLDFIVVDYLQIVQTRQNFRGQREQVVSHVSMSLKKLLKSLDVTGFIGAQINRSAREDPATPPKLSALRESGSIEQDADRVIFVHTPPVNRAGVAQDSNNATDEVDIIQRKSRNGPRDVSVTVNFTKQFTLYTEAARKGDARPGLPKPNDGYKREG